MSVRISLAGLTLLAGSGVLPVSISLCLDSVHNHVKHEHLCMYVCVCVCES